MDDLGSLVKHYGIKPGGKSSPMIASKTAKKTHVGNSVSNQDPIFSTQSAVNSTQNPLSGTGFPLNFQIDDDIFGLNQNANISSNVHSSGGGGGGGGGLFDFDVEPVFENSKNKSFDVSDDLMAWGSSVGGSGNVGGSVSGGDLLSSDPVDDFWKKMGDLGLDQRGVKRLDEKKGSFGGDDDLLAGFSWSNTANDREASTAKNVLGKTVKQKETNFLDIDGILNGGSIHQEKLGKSTGSMFDAETPDLESMFRAQTQKNDKAVNRKIDEVPDFMFGNTISVEKKILPRNLPNDFLLFGDAQTSEQFKEINGESDSRREARYQRYLDTKARIAQAVADMNQREFEAKQEQEERHRAAETMGVELDRWKAGKEGNLRALLSSLQQVLGPEYGWRAVTLTDLITSSQVKIAYKKAALCVHPDKVQHKGAQQKYVAEKVFDLLKEAWNKFNAEELR